jgi:proteasome accessory factor C
MMSLSDDIDLLNVVNFGGGTYVLYAEIDGDRIEVDPDTYGDNFARPARLLPLEAKALAAAIDLFGDHLPQSGPPSARKTVAASAMTSEGSRSPPRAGTTPT